MDFEQEKKKPEALFGRHEKAYLAGNSSPLDWLKGEVL